MATIYLSPALFPENSQIIDCSDDVSWIKTDEYDDSLEALNALSFLSNSAYSASKPTIFITHNSSEVSLSSHELISAVCRIYAETRIMAGLSFTEHELEYDLSALSEFSSGISMKVLTLSHCDLASTKSPDSDMAVSFILVLSGTLCACSALMPSILRVILQQLGVSQDDMRRSTSSQNFHWLADVIASGYPGNFYNKKSCIISPSTKAINLDLDSDDEANGEGSSLKSTSHVVNPSQRHAIQPRRRSSNISNLLELSPAFFTSSSSRFLTWLYLALRSRPMLTTFLYAMLAGILGGLAVVFFKVLWMSIRLIYMDTHHPSPAEIVDAAKELAPWERYTIFLRILALSCVATSSL